MKPKTSPNRLQQPLENLPRPSAFIQTKHAIMQSMDAKGLREAEKMIDRYIFSVCEKSLRESHKLDLVYILNFRTSQLIEDGIDVPEPIHYHEEEILNINHQKLSA